MTTEDRQLDGIITDFDGYESEQAQELVTDREAWWDASIEIRTRLSN